MPKSTKARKLSPGTTSTSRCQKHNTNSKNRISSKISKYFNSNQNADISLESPYKNLSSHKNIEPIEISDDCDDFKTPKSARVAKIFEMSKSNTLNSKNIKDNKSSKAKAKNKSKQGRKVVQKDYITKSVDDNSVNTEHLHMAIALSKSEVQSVESNNENADDLSSQEKMTNFKAALEQFGFNMPNKNRFIPLRNNITESNKNKKSKFKCITPVLCTRTESDRLELVINKISQILSLNNECVGPIENKRVQVITQSLTEFFAEGADFFNKNGTCLKNEDYYVANLNIPHTEYIPGCLLRNWSDIPGRDKTPDRLDECFELKRNSECENTLITHTNKSIEKFCDKSGLNNKPCCVDNKEDVRCINKLPSVEENYLDITKSFGTSKTSCSKNRLLSPDLFSSSEDDEYPLNDVEANLIENDSVLNNTISQIDKFNQLTVGSDLECVQLHKLEKILSTNISDDLKTQENSISLIDTNEENIDNLYEDHLTSNSKDTAMQEDTLNYQVDKCLTVSTDSDYCIIENSVEKCNLKRFSSFNSTTSVDSMASFVSEVSIVISDEELNYSTINSASGKKHKRKRNVEHADSNKSPIFKNLANETSTNEKVSSDLECVQLHKFEKILSTNISDDLNTQENSISLIDTNEENIDNLYEDHLTSNSKDTAMQEDTLNYQVDKCLTVSTDSDCCIIENSVEKCNLKRFNSFNSTTSVDSMGSHISDVSIVISDEELNYSTINSASGKKHKRKWKIEHDTSDVTNDTSMNEKVSTNLVKQDSILDTLDIIASKYIQATEEVDNLLNNPLHFHDTNFELNKSTLIRLNSNDLNQSKSSLINEVQISPISTQSKIQTTKVSTSANVTPSIDDLIIKTDNITPVPNYMDMDTPKIAGELKKFGLKPLKRKRGVQLLQYLYDATHPEVPHEKFEDEACGELGVKRLKVSSKEIATKITNTAKIEIVGDLIDDREPIESLIFEHRKSAKISTCAVPLNIAWHNLLAANSSIRENMLMYEPLEVERVYALLKAQGFKYKDLITFFDKKCITIRTKQNTGKRKSTEN